MIEIPSPSMAMNSHDVPKPKYYMDNTYFPKKEDSPIAMLSWVAVVLKAFKDERPKDWITLVINCHGVSKKHSDGKSYGGYGLSIGTGIKTATDVEAFALIEPYVDRIYLVACRAAMIANPGDAWNGDGNLFCGAIAKKARAQVVASTARQSGFPYIPAGYIDDFEGTVYTYGPKGDVLSYEEG